MEFDTNKCATNLFSYKKLNIIIDYTISNTDIQRVSIINDL